jgi:hypothetical protein
MTTPFGCFHCESTEHWRENCPLLVPPADKADHQQRITEYKRMFDYEEIGPLLKQRLITEENRMWTRKQKEMARQ